VVECGVEQRFLMSPEQLAGALGPKTKAVILCTPSNSTGSAYAEHEMRALLDVLRGHDCWIVVDEIYADLVYDGFQYVTPAVIAPDMRDRILVVDGVAKSYAMTGWRIGWTLGPKHVISAITMIQGQSTTNATAVAQYAALDALTGSQDEVHAMRDAFERRRDVMVDGLNALPGFKCRKPEGAFYAFADCRGLYGLEHEGRPIASDTDVALWLLDRAHVVTVPGSGFGAPGYLRFSYATREDRITTALDVMRGAIAQTKRVSPPPV
jgi:aspartate aminotransferase